MLCAIPLLEALELDELDELLELLELDDVLELEELDDVDELEELDELDEPVFSPPHPDKTHKAASTRLKEQNDFIVSPNNYVIGSEPAEPKHEHQSIIQLA